MAHYEVIDGKPVLGIEGEYIVVAAKALGRVTSLRGVEFHVVIWEAGRGARFEYLTPAEFADWRWSFVVPAERN